MLLILYIDVKQQQAIVAKFHSGEHNVLIATKVAEEGLDFRACNLVVRFDALTTVTGYVETFQLCQEKVEEALTLSHTLSYIQSRGRARAADARYVVLAAQGSLEASRYRHFVQQEVELQGLYADRTDEPDEQAEPDLDNLPTYTTPRGALLSHGSAISTLSGFCQILKVDEFTPLQKPTFAIAAGLGGWVAELRVPKNAALSEHTFVSASMPTRRAAKQNAAFQACIALHGAGALNDHLLPLRASRSEDAQEDVDGRTLDRRPLAPNLEVQLVNPFGNVYALSTAHIYVFEVSTRPPSRIAMVCGVEVEVPPRTLYGPDDCTFELHLLAHDRLDWQNWAERDDRLSALETFNRRLSRVVLNRRFGDDRIYALWAPVNETGNLDWELVADPFEVADFASLAPGSPVVVPLRRPTVRFGRFAGLRQDVTASSLPSEIERDSSKQKQKLAAK